MARKGKSAGDICEILRERILSWGYKPGQRLKEEELCREFKVSRAPVRDALNILAAEKLVEKKANAGCRVKQWSMHELDNLYDFRIAIETFAVGAIDLNEETTAVIEAQRALWSGLLETGDDQPLDSAGMAKKDEDLHTVIVELTNNSFLIEAHKQINERLRFLRTNDITTFERLRNTCEQHLVILDRLLAGDADGARQSLRDNICTGKNHVEISVGNVLKSMYLKKPTN